MHELARRPDLQLVRGLAAWPRFDWPTLLTAMQQAAEGFALAGRARDAALTRTNVRSGLHHAGRLAEASNELAQLRTLKLDDAARAFVYYTSAWDALANARTDEAAPMFAEMLVSLERAPVPMLWSQFATHCVFVGLPGMQPLRQHSPLSHRRVHESELLFVHAMASWILQDHAAWRALDADLQRAGNACEWPAAALNRAMSQAFSKLGVDTRGQAAARWREMAPAQSDQGQ